MQHLFQVILYQPIFNLFVGLYGIIPDVGVVIFLVTVLIKLILYPLTTSSINAQKSLSALQPHLEEIKKQYKDDKKKIGEETMKLYAEHKVNPLGSCLPLIIQLPIFIALYWVLRAGLASSNFELLYPFIKNPGHINTVTFGTVDLKGTSAILAIAAGAAQYWQAKMMTTKRPPANAGDGAKDEDMTAMMNKQMLYMMPLVTILIGFRLPAGLTLYWLLSTVLTALQQKVVFGKKINPLSSEERAG